ncbi:carbon-nitrogen hydrolase family protein [Gemmatimonadota bacterium]
MKDTLKDPWTIHSFRLLVITSLLLICSTVGHLEAYEGGTETFRAGCAQIFFGKDVQKNLERILQFIRRADSLGVDVLLFPETALSGYASVDFKDSPFPSKNVLDEALDSVREAAKATGVWVIIGTSSVVQDGLYNVLHMIDDRGEIRASYAKAHLTTDDDGFYHPGDKIIAYNLDGLDFGMQICFDIRFPESWRMLALQGARVIFHSAYAAGGSSWKIPVMEGHLRSRAAENGVWVVSCNKAGPVQMQKSYIVDPNGLIVAESNQDREELITGIVDLRVINPITTFDRRRTDIYGLNPVENISQQKWESPER